MRKIHNKKTILFIILSIFLIIYYIYYKNNNHNKYETILNDENIVFDKEKEENLQESDNEVQNPEDEGNEIIIVHITGEVKNWGVIELEKGARVMDAVNKAGGLTEEADVEKVNLAYILSDGVKIYIPSKNNENDIEYIIEESGEKVVTEEKKMEKANNALININNATQTELESLPGIGPSTALKIILYREENGKFSSIEDIKNVSGIGENKFNNIKQLICI